MMHTYTSTRRVILHPEMEPMGMERNIDGLEIVHASVEHVRVSTDKGELAASYQEVPLTTKQGREICPTGLKVVSHPVQGCS